MVQGLNVASSRRFLLIIVIDSTYMTKCKKHYPVQLRYDPTPNTRYTSALQTNLIEKAEFTRNQTEISLWTKGA